MITGVSVPFRCRAPEEKNMELWIVILVIAGWVILNKWILPKAGIAT